MTTPQEVSLIDARKGLEMFRQVRVPVLGIVENMSYFVGDRRQTLRDLPSAAAASKLATEAGVPFLGEIPIDPRVAECGDQGEPIVHCHPDSPVAQAYLALAKTVAQELQSGAGQPGLPTIEL